MGRHKSSMVKMPRGPHGHGCAKCTKDFVCVGMYCFDSERPLCQVCFKVIADDRSMYRRWTGDDE